MHFEAVPPARVPGEMDAFLAWFESGSTPSDRLIRAALAHLRFLTIHPFDDGNGRVARALWLTWFLGCVERALEGAEVQFDAVLREARFWHDHRSAALNERQRKVIHRMLAAGPGGFEGGLTNRRYAALTRASRATAQRDLAELAAAGLLVRRAGGGRSAAYDLAT